MTRDAYINHEKGIHARVAAMIVQKARELEESYEVRIYLKYGEKAEIPASNMMPLVSLQIKKGDTVIVEVRGRDTKSAVDEMVGFLESDFQINDLRLQELDSVIQDTTFTAEQVFSSMVNGLLVIDDNEVVTIFNPAAERILGLSAADVIGKKIFEVLPSSRLHVVLGTREAELGKKQVIGESVIITNRTPIVVDGKTRGAMAIFEDISALEQTVGELREVKELKESLKQKYSQALHVINNLHKRNLTLISIVEVLVEEQRFFFDEGIDLKPLTREVVAKRLGLHESTVSRAVRDKYISTTYGVFPLAFFFSSTLSGISGEISSLSVKDLLREIVAGEDPLSPYTDSVLQELLAKEGITISRRTVAKYRNQLGIPPVKLRIRY